MTAHIFQAGLLCVRLTYAPLLPTVLPVCGPVDYLDRNCHPVAERVYACPEPRRRVVNWGPRA